MRGKLLAISFSDLHLHNWTKFNAGGTRTDSSLSVLKMIFSLGIKHNVPILFSGDWLHTKESINMELAIKLAEFYDMYSNELKLHVYGINGNHDFPFVNTYEKQSKGYLHTLLPYPWIKCIDFQSWKVSDKLMVHGIPYLDNNVGLKNAIKSIKLDKTRKNILLLHTDYDGAKDTNGRIIGSTENLDRTLLRKFDLVLCGHIHKHQKLSKNVYMVGAPYQQRFTDEGNEMGYLKIYEDLSVKFVPIKNMPRFITLLDETEIPDDGNFYQLLKTEKQISKSPGEGRHFKRSNSKIKMAKEYLRVRSIEDPGKKRALLNIFRKVEKESHD